MTPFGNRSFSFTSRYQAIPTTTRARPDGSLLVHLQRRFLPPVERFSLLQQHTVVRGQRLDHIAASYFSDPEQFWRLCDANNAMIPRALTAEPGRVLDITLPEGIAGR